MKHTLHVVPHTHWDREWYQPFQTFCLRLVHLMDRLLDTLARDPAYSHFMLDGQTIVLEDYIQVRPERRAELETHVRSGRLSIGPWHVLPDEFLVAPESLVRNLLMGDRICRRFGARMPVGYIPDPFGHVGQMPQILAGFGIQAAALRRGLDDEPVELTWESPDGSRVWLAYLRDGYDNAARLPVADAQVLAETLDQIGERLAPQATSRHLLLLNGSDHHEPQPELPGLIAEIGQRQLSDNRIALSSLSAYFDAVRQELAKADLPLVRGELRSPKRHHLLPGVLSARMGIKQRNDAIESLLTGWAEPLAAWAEGLEPEPNEPSVLGGDLPIGRVARPQALIWQAWRLLLENHPHDSICGCSIDQVHREMITRFDQAEQIGQEITRQSLATIAQCVDTLALAPYPLIVFNPSSGPRSDPVSVRLHLPGRPDSFEVVDAAGRVLPHQASLAQGRELAHLQVTPAELRGYLGMVQDGRLMGLAIRQIDYSRRGEAAHVLVVLSETGEPNSTAIEQALTQVDEGLKRFHIRVVIAAPTDLLFVARDLPGHGYASLCVRPAEGQGAKLPPREAETRETEGGPICIENEFFRVEAGPDGRLELSDKQSGGVYPGLNHFVDGGDRGDTYNYCPPEADRLVDAPASPAQIERVESGPVRWTLEVRQTYRLPRSLSQDRAGRSPESVDLPIVSRIHLYPGVRRVDVETRVDNTVQDHRLRVHFPVPVRVDQAHTEGHFDVVGRPVPPALPQDTQDWAEQPTPTVPQRGWADLSDGQTGLMVANRGLPEVEFIRGQGETTIALTLLRCVGWLSRDDLACRQGPAGPRLATPEAQCPGIHVFHYALIPHQGGWQNACAQAEAFRAPLQAAATRRSPGPLPPTGSLVQVQPPSFRLTAIKLPEKGPGLIVRGVNLSDDAAPDTRVRLKPWRRFARAIQTDLNEEPIQALDLDPGGGVSLEVGRREIATVRFE